MKNARMSLFIFGILTVFLSGCFNPITVIPSKQGNPAVDPFTIDVVIGQDTEAARSEAGPDAETIKYGGIRNIIQLIVVDQDGNIAAFDEVRRANDSQKDAALKIESIAFGKTYNFLLLMGHWERDYESEQNGNYEYKENIPPTLLAAGLKEQLITGSGKVTVTMWPIVVDTVFTTAEVSPGTVQPVVTDGQPQKVSLPPVNWGVTWTIKRGTGGNGLADLLRAQNIITPGGSDDPLRLLSKTTIARATGHDDSVQSHGVETGDVISLLVNTFTSGIQCIQTEGSVNFKLEYVPFNLTASGESNPWNAFNGDSAFDLGADKTPVWIIRNGVNDLAQNENTDFENLGKAGHSTANGNGAVSFVVAEEIDAGLVIRNGELARRENTAMDITFTTEGYSGEAGVYYAIVPKDSGDPPYSAYAGYLGSFGIGDYRTGITLPKAGINYDVYLRLFKGGKVSNHIKINTGADNIEVVPGWGEGKAITAFSITSPVNAAGVINESAKTVTVTVPYGTSVTNMTTSITVSDAATVSPASGTPRNFSTPQTYTVTAGDTSTQSYTVTVIAAPLGPGTGITDTVNGVNFGMRYVPAGTFQRDAASANVTVLTKGYWIGETEVTQDLWNAVMGIRSFGFNTNPEDTGANGWKKLPAEGVNWYDAIAFCNKLSLMAGKTPVYSVGGITDWGTLPYESIPNENLINAAWNAVTINAAANGYRLPTEMEWMWAAMGADKTQQPNRTGYSKAFAGSGGGNIDNYAWHSGNSGGTTHQVGKKLPNELGLYDMSGNVWEWCIDFWDSGYPYGEKTDYVKTSSTGLNRVMCAGGWAVDKSYCKVLGRTDKSWAQTKYRSNKNGLRVVRNN
jgi:formylglycine-generating enzyme required for sulfatase activity